MVGGSSTEIATQCQTWSKGQQCQALHEQAKPRQNESNTVGTSNFVEMDINATYTAQNCTSGNYAD